MSLTVYRLRANLDGRPLDDPALALRSADAVVEHQPLAAWDFNPRLFVARSVATYPEWARALMPFYPENTFGRVRGAGAVLFLTPPAHPDVWFAVTWGHRGRYLLRPDSFVRHFGLRTALNLIYATDGDGGARVRSVDAKTVTANTLRTRRQTDRRAPFEDFGVDARRDLLYGITGRPAEVDDWGPRVSGTDRLSITRGVPFAELGGLCDGIETAYRQEDYQEHFSWIDNLSIVSDPSMVSGLLDHVVREIRAGETTLQLAVPDLVEWGEISQFRFSFAEDRLFADPEDVLIAEWLYAAGRLERLSVSGLRGGHRLEALDVAGERIGRWSILQCLSGEVEFGGELFVLSEGDFFRVSDNLVQELADFVNELPTSTLALPASPGEVHEHVYNAHAAETLDRALLLDRRNVRIARATTPVEVCDLLSADARFVHVKRKLGSSQLSHLFSQGARSFELAVTSPAFRRVTLERIAEVATEVGVDVADFRPFTEEAIDPRSISVDYAIVAKWNGRRPSQGLPFFSQLNLRSFVASIENLGGNVTLTRIEIVE